MKPHKCPVCDGKGRLVGGWGVESCSACGGSGIVWEVESQTEREVVKQDGGGLPLEEA